MEIQSVVRKIIITVNGIDHVIEEQNWTESVLSGIECGNIKNEQDLIEWIEIDN